ncbi:hypothetical protein KC19_4G244300 [Ceratodon purpureus]|uniref:Peroxidase n=1 Tax=Ceratodon purpureus TaxID=3225 RepID=A0A8T0IEQ4_CERPU|nr:hypothetical protein KC19_4G244300 [Ceratodon purpureus]
MARVRTWLQILALVAALRYSSVQVEAQLMVGFYRTRNCLYAEAIVRQTVTAAINDDPSVAASLIRMLFHDCFVEGCDASILLDASPQNPVPEKDAVPNVSIRGFEVIDAAKAALEKTCPSTVSCADIIALAARDAVELSGGQSFNMPTGRLDGTVSSADSAASSLPSPLSSTIELTQMFLEQGLSQDEMITLSGAHTIGSTTCKQIMSRIYGFDGTKTGVDPNIDFDYALYLRRLCPEDGNTSRSVPLDSVSPNKFDNMYYMNGITGRVLFPSDTTLFEDGQTQFASKLNSQNEDLWEVKFANAMVHMSSIKVKTAWPDQRGEVRLNCRVTNAGK